MSRAAKPGARVWAAIVLGGAASAVLGGCDIAPNIRLHNGVGRSLALEVAKGNREAKRVRLDPGEAVRVWNIYGPDLRIRFDGCEWRYALPYMDLNHPWREPDGAGGSRPDYDHLYPVEIQLQPDHVLYLRPDAAKGVVRLDELVGAQGHGFPLKPSAKTCGGPTPPA